MDELLSARTITAVLVGTGGPMVYDHPPIRPAVGYRIEYQEKAVVITGDTILTETLRQHSRGADLLISEAMSKTVVARMEVANENLGYDFNANILHDIQDYHMDIAEVAALAREAGVKRLALTHLTPPIDNDFQLRMIFKRPVAAVFNGELIVGPDGTRAIIPIDSESRKQE